MLDLRPDCEHCGIDLPPASTDAMICSFECTFCSDCVACLGNVCPNCGGGFAARPVRPVHDWNGGSNLAAYPATTRRFHRGVDLDAHHRLRSRLGDLPPERR